MDAAFILLSIGGMVGLMAALPTLANGIAEYLKAKGNSVGNKLPNNLEERLARLEAAMNKMLDTRDASLQHSFSVEQNMEMLQNRLAHLERKAEEEQATTTRSEQGR